MERFILLQDIKDDTKYINSLEDWGLILNNIENPLPTPKTDYIDNSGGDGTIDNTEVLDEVKYNDRTIKFTFTMREEFNDIEDIKSKIANYVHGKRFKITTYRDLEYYYIGRISMEDFAINKAMGTFKLVATCKPYKYRQNITSYTYNIDNVRTINIYNEKKYVIPKMTLSNDMTVEFEDKEYSLESGTHEVLNIYLKQGINILKITGTGIFKIEYQEASL